MIEQLAGQWWLFILIGLGAGMLSGTLGVGSGIIVIPILVLIARLPQQTAQGTALALMVPMALLGAIRYWRQGDLQIDPAALLLMIAGALAGVLLGTDLAHRISGDLLRKIFAAFILAVAVKMFFTPEQPRLSKESNQTGQRSYESAEP